MTIDSTSQVRELLDGDKKGLKESSKIILEKVHKNKPRVQKGQVAEGGSEKTRLWRGLKQVKQFFKAKKDAKSADQAQGRT